ncbi:auxin response factor 3-like [Solanum dulcamara]|uniref:auxin response factor 3-like n=1 Tax=Solanum dulcamara TaxID=45834 RepID=UPI002485D3B5|nr:auxin response factor 3-like [Solanum dulcamara]
MELNTVDNDDMGEKTTTPISLDSPASVASGSLDLTLSTPPSAMASVCMEHWHVCAGPLFRCRRKEVLSYTYLKADETFDDVYVQVSLAPRQSGNRQSVVDVDEYNKMKKVDPEFY